MSGRRRAVGWGLALAAALTVTSVPNLASAAPSHSGPALVGRSDLPAVGGSGLTGGDVLNSVGRGAWVGAWATSPQREVGPVFSRQTLRMLVHPTVGGGALRIRLSNAFGAADVSFGAVGVLRAVASGSAELVAGTSRRVT